MSNGYGFRSDTAVLFDVDAEHLDVTGAEAGNAGGLAERARAHFRQLFAALVRECAHALVIDIFRDQHRFHTGRLRHLFALAVGRVSGCFRDAGIPALLIPPGVPGLTAPSLTVYFPVSSTNTWCSSSSRCLRWC